MKKILCLISALAMMAAPISAFADDTAPETVGEIRGGDNNEEKNNEEEKTTETEENVRTTITETSDPQKAEVIITTEIAPTYLVTIPVDTKVPFNSTQTEFGKVELTKARLEPDKLVKVTVSSEFTLKNKTDAENIIPYKIYAQHRPPEGESGLTMPVLLDNTALYFSQEGMDFDLNIIITEDDWNNAPAGSYSDTVTFEIEYAPSEFFTSEEQTAEKDKPADDQTEEEKPAEDQPSQEEAEPRNDEPSWKEPDPTDINTDTETNTDQQQTAENDKTANDQTEEYKPAPSAGEKNLD